MKKIKNYKIISGVIILFMSVLAPSLYAETLPMSTDFEGFNPGTFPGRSEVISTNDKAALSNFIDGIGIQTKNDVMQRILSKINNLQIQIQSTESDRNTLFTKINFLWDIRDIIHQKAEELENMVGAPTFTLASNGVSGTQVSLLVNINEPGVGNYVILPGSPVSPSLSQINAGLDSFGTSAMSGSVYLTGGTNIINVGGLAMNTSYTLFFTAKDFAGNQLNIGSIPVQTNSNTTTIFSTVSATSQILQIGSLTNNSAQASINISSGLTGLGYYVVLPSSAIAPSVGQIKSGQDSFGIPSLSGNWAIASGNNQFSITGLNPSTSYIIYYTLPDINGNYQTVSSTAFQTTPVSGVQPITVNSITNTSVMLSIGGSGLGYYVIVPSGSLVPTGIQIRNGQDYFGNQTTFSGSWNTPVNGNQINVNGLSPNTNYVIYYTSPDVNGNFQIVSSATFQTSQIGVPNSISIGSIGSTSASVLINTTGPTTGYYVVLPSGSAMPTSSEIANGQNSSSISVIPSGTVSLNTGSNTINVGSLNANTSYILYFETLNNMTPVSLAFTTSF